jgi:hypothetical protein
VIVAVTTRSRLRGLRFFPVMLVATIRVRRQLARTEGVVRWASVLAGPREFWTVTVWRSRHEMQEFMRSGAHGEIMWLLPRWLSSFWLMRWGGGERELGSWDGLTLARHAAAGEGAVSPFIADDVRRPRADLSGAGGAVVRIRTRPRRLPAALGELRRLRRRLRADPRLLGSMVGWMRWREAYLVALWSERPPARELVDGEWARAARARWGDRLWAHEWLPENEFGHWDGLRVRARPPLRPARAARDPAGERRPSAPAPSR